MEEIADKRDSIAILIPVSDSIPGLFLSSFARALMFYVRRGFAVGHYTSNKVPLDQARELLWKNVLSMKPAPKYVLWLDADMLISESHLQKMEEHLKNHPEIDAVSGLYFKKMTHEPVCFREIGGKMKTFMPDENNPTEVDAVGLGAVLLRTESVVGKLNAHGTGVRRFFWFDDDVSEDVNFFLLLKKHGVRTVVLPIIIPHIGGIIPKIDKIG